MARTKRVMGNAHSARTRARMLESFGNGTSLTRWMSAVRATAKTPRAWVHGNIGDELCVPEPRAGEVGHSSAMDVNHLFTKRVIFSRHQEVTPTVTFQRLFRVTALGLSGFALMASTPAEPVAAQVAPPRGVVEGTGYRQFTLDDGSVGPVTFVVKGKKAAAIRLALGETIRHVLYAGLHGDRQCVQDHYSDPPGGQRDICGSRGRLPHSRRREYQR